MNYLDLKIVQRKCFIRLFGLGLFLLTSLNLLSQNELPERIRISKGVNKFFSKNYGWCKDVYFINELEYNLTDSNFYIRKKDNKSFKKIDCSIPSIFTDQETYYFLDSLFNSNASYTHYAKRDLYRIELLYLISDYPTHSEKIKSFVFNFQSYPDGYNLGNIIEGLLFARKKIIKDFNEKYTY